MRLIPVTSKPHKLLLQFFILGISFLAKAQGPLEQQQAPPKAPVPIVDPAHETAGPLPIDTGKTGLQLMLRKLKTTARLMQIVAHPDDEDGAMMAWQSRGKGTEVMLLTLTRGDGGQNKTGSNLFDELGVLRTLELLSSDRYYGAEQRFTRAADFGFTKTAQEALDKWKDHDAVLGDMVRAIREFRPDVVASGWSGTPADGHGQHQASGILTPLAVASAADPNRFPEQIKEGLQPWTVKRLYVRTRSSDGDMCFEASAVDPVLGRTYAEYGIEGYSHQRSQNAAIFPPRPAPDVRCYKLVFAAQGYEVKPGTKQKDFFEGMDTSLAGLAGRLAEEQEGVTKLRQDLRAISDQIDEVERAIGTGKSERDVELLYILDQVNKARLMAETRVRGLTSNSDVSIRLRSKGIQLEKTAALEFGIRLDASFDAGVDSFVVPGQEVAIEVRLTNAGRNKVRVDYVLPGATGTWAIIGRQSPTSGELPPGGAFSTNFKTQVPKDAELTRPYWHRGDPERDTLHDFGDSPYQTYSLPSFPVHPIVVYSIEGEAAMIGEVARKAANQNTALAVVPEFSLLMEHGSLTVPIGRTAKEEINVQVRNNAPWEAEGKVRLSVPKGWKVEPAEQTVKFAAREEKKVGFTVTPVATEEGRSEIKAELKWKDKTFSEGFSVISRSDLQTFYYYQPSVQKVSVVRVKVPAALKVGYLPGAGDDIVPVLEQLGLDVHEISAEELASGDLGKYDTIVLGIRAYDTREDLRKYNSRLLAFAENGGTLIVQNNFSTGDFNKGNWTPYPATLSRDRVSDENAPVQFLLPNDPLLNSPNKLGPRDFDGWVQERGVNFISSWDAKYDALLASNDPGESPLKGGLLRAKVGKGTYIYTGYAFFRQLPAGVPGAIRLFVNLLAAGHEN